MINSYDIAIVGAGISSLMLAHNLPNKKIMILEKAKGVGGRLATRRMQDIVINHGAKKIVLNHPLLLKMASLGIDQNILEIKNGLCFPAQSMNQWAKMLAKDLDVIKETLVTKIIKNDSGLYELRDNNDLVKVIAKNIVLAAPAPQSHAILKQSGFEADFLLEATYSSVIQFLAILHSPILSTSAIWETLDLKQHTALSNGELYHLEYKDDIARNFLEKDNKYIQAQLVDMLQKEGNQIIETHVHKWRYSEVTNPVPSKYQLEFSQDNIYLLGDYFFGNDLNSCAKSVEHLLYQTNF